MSTFVTRESDVDPLKAKQSMTDKCVYFCAKGIRMFYIMQGEGFVALAQELINVGASRR